MQTIKVTTEKVNNGLIFSIGTETIATTWECKGTQYSEMKRVLHPYGCRQDMHISLPDAVEFIGDCISKHFANFGLNVEFS